MSIITILLIISIVIIIIYVIRQFHSYLTLTSTSPIPPTTLTTTIPDMPSFIPLNVDISQYDRPWEITGFCLTNDCVTGKCLFNECLQYAKMDGNRYMIIADIESNSNTLTSGNGNIRLSAMSYNKAQQFKFNLLDVENAYAIKSVLDTTFSADDDDRIVNLSTTNTIGVRQIFSIVKLNKYPDRYLITNYNSGKAIQANQSQLTLEIPNQDDPRQRFRFIAIRS